MTIATPNLDEAESLVELLDGASEALRTHPGRRGCAVRVPARGRLLATGDLHDNPFHFAKVVAAAGLDRGLDRHVVLHELIHGERLVNGMDFSYRMLGKVAALVLAHPGQVHPILANHEIAQVTGRGVSKGAGNSVELFRDAVEWTFGDAAGEVDDAIGRFVRAMPLAFVAEGSVLCAHSVPAPHAIDRFDFDVLDRELVEADFLGPDGAAYLMTWGRGLDAAHLERLAAHWGVKLLVLGHQHVPTGIEALGPAVILNSDHEAGRVLPIDLADPIDPQEAALHALPLASL